MWKFFFIYPVVLLTMFLLTSEVNIGISWDLIDDNHVSIEFPKVAFRSAENSEPWYRFYWNAGSTQDEL